MTSKRFQWIAAFLTALGGSVLLYAQNPVSISQVGTTPVTTTVPVSGTVTANAGSGTMAVSAASLPLPSGASTAAKQPALGTAGSASTDVLTVQGIASMTALKVDGSAVTQPVSGTFWQATQPVSGTVTANMGTVTADPFGANADAASATGSISAKLRFIANTGIPITGTVTVGSHAVTVASGGIASGAVASGAVASGAFASGSIASGAIASGAVASGAYASDSGSFGVGSTGSAPPAKASYIAGVTSGATGGLLGGATVCDSQAFLDMTTATTTEIVALTASRKIYVCYWLAMANGTTVMTFKRGTGTNCGTGTTSISPAWDLTAQVGFSGGAGLAAIFDNQNAGDALCVTNSAAVNLHIYLRYAKY